VLYVPQQWPLWEKDVGIRRGGGGLEREREREREGERDLLGLTPRPVGLAECPAVTLLQSHPDTALASRHYANYAASSLSKLAGRYAGRLVEESVARL
jgi:hypothetical protein